MSCLLCCLGEGTSEERAGLLDDPEARAARENAAEASALYEKASTLHVGDGHKAEVIELYRQALVLAPQRLDVMYNLGNALQDMDQRDEAAACYKQVLRLAPDHHSAWYVEARRCCCCCYHCYCYYSYHTYHLLTPHLPGTTSGTSARSRASSGRRPTASRWPSSTV